ncbi:hypothetical protein AB205_0177270 [Aquarana catesbeiana]|uniref:Uncharacterized protein n=1 Tax=Aquarana catesbeiana TaxID=8400 RepID=A0A2G9QI08_AQUCT|nr:hypothetical protein AB205_0177270 [Aquarana catesbeiana]
MSGLSLINVTKNNVIQQRCWFVQKSFYKHTCEYALSKNVETQQCVASYFNAQAFFGVSWCLQ